MKNDLCAIFTLRINDKNSSKPIEALFSKYSKFTQQGSDLVYNVSASENKLNTIIDTILDEQLISITNSFKVYFYYPSSGFKVFIIKSEDTSNINESDLRLLKSLMSKFI